MAAASILTQSREKKCVETPIQEVSTMLLLDAKRVLVLYTNDTGRVCVKMYPETDEVRSYYSPVNIKLAQDMIFRVTSRTPDGDPKHFELYVDWLYSSLRVYNSAYLNKQFDNVFMFSPSKRHLANRSNWELSRSS